ncbi:YlmH/Sll1252 family protein [Ruminococcaceae bacterium OttesenSCG-928-A16]|nr:YlmH/Sll1252 family protein [Ruminococcaceae bacterium OttesenSCG-928-A16]
MNEQEKLVGRKVADAVKAVSHSGVSRYLGFFNLREAELATAELNRQKWQAYAFYGGFEGAERTMLCIFDETDAASALPHNFPFVAVLAKLGAAQQTTLTHRDYLGAVLGAGVKRECVGDIINTDDGTVLLLQRTMLPFLQEQLTQVGRASIELVECDLPTIKSPAPQDVETASVSSLRADAVLAAMLNLNRAGAAAIITKGLLQINHLQVSAGHYTICEGDVFSVRGTGKFVLHKIGGKSRKDRTFIEFIRYR